MNISSILDSFRAFELPAFEIVSSPPSIALICGRKTMFAATMPRINVMVGGFTSVRTV